MKKDWKSSPPRVTRIALVDDDSQKLEQDRELIAAEFPSLTIYCYESIFSAYHNLRCFDYLLIDVSSVAPPMGGDVARAWAPISKYLSEYPRTELIICTAASRNCVNDVMDDIVEQGGIDRSRLHYGGFMWSGSSVETNLKDVLHSLIKPEDLVWTKCRKSPRR
jgi:hypothetical protein